MAVERTVMATLIYKKENINTIIKLAQQGDVKALEELIRRVQKNVFTMFSYMTEKRQDVADLTQEALLKTAGCINSLKDTKCFKSWLNHIVTNTFYDYLKKHSNDEKVDFDNDRILEIKDKLECEPFDRCFFTEIDKLIKSALLDLPVALRVVIILREYEGLSYEDIAEITKTTIGTVKSRISRARVKLQKQLKEFI
jgi:RNA polymerase sigma-70 factor (ECF subfamily)